MDATSKTQTEVKTAYAGLIVAWFCNVYIITKWNPPQRNISPWLLAGAISWTVYGMFGGFIMRKKFLKQSAEAPDLRTALGFWRAAHFVAFCCAMNSAIVGVVLRWLGIGWVTIWIFLGLGLAFLLLWRPRPPAVSAGQQASS